MRLDIHYRTRFRYPGPVYESQNELRACPATDEHQQRLYYHVTTTPSSRVQSYTDYWGTHVDTFGVRGPHVELEVMAEATVETAAPTPAPTFVDWGALSDQEFVDGHLEFLQRSPHVDWGERIVGAARACAEEGRGDLMRTIAHVHRRAGAVDYRRGATYVGVTVDEVFERDAGVCQDIAHLALAMFRELAIPARYVSGYLFTGDDATGEDAAEDQVRVETHAWVEVALPGWGWLAMDPTNAQEVGERHVTIGRGRDYDDVAPLRGVFSGAQEHDLDVEVTMRRLSTGPLGEVSGASTWRTHAQQQQQ